ncbi:MAG TPA: hypothetical protein VF599_12625 [Pyrinomonadaceae bacterium]|jgi:hypothetical protein
MIGNPSKSFERERETKELVRKLAVITYANLKAIVTTGVKDQELANDFVRRIAELEFDVCTELEIPLLFDSAEPEKDREAFVLKNLVEHAKLFREDKK